MEDIKVGNFVVEYKGQLLSGSDGEIKETEYEDIYGSFLYFFKHESINYW